MATRRAPTAKRQPAPRVWTYKDYLCIPEDGYRYEVVWGELIMPPAPVPAHQRVVLRLATLLLEHVATNDLGAVYVAPLDVVLSEHNVLQPDILFIRKDRLNIVTETHVAGSPDLVIEVLSPGTAAADRGRRMDAYAAFGVPHCWLVDPRSHTFEVYELRGERYELVARFTEGDAFRSALFPGLNVSSDALW